MGQLFTQKYPNNIRTILGLINIPKQDDVTLLCDTTLGAVEVQLLGIPENYWSTQYKLYIIDKSTTLHPSGNASVNNITIVAPIGTLINGLPSVVINSNGGGYVIIVTSNTNYGATYCGAGAFGGGGYTTVEDEGVALPPRTTMNFVGAGVTATDIGGKTVVTINGSGGITSITNAGYLALMSTNSVVQGQYYLITDALYTDGGVVVQGILPNAPPSVNGVGIHLNADYQNTGNYSGVTGFASWKNIWCLPAVPVVTGDVVIWNNLHYKNLTGNWGTAPDGDAVNWQVLPKSTTNGYKLECDFVKYNLILNAIIYRADRRLNEVDLHNFESNISLVKFQWGRDLVSANKLKSASLMLTTNSYCTFKRNTLDSGTMYDQTNRQGQSSLINLNYISEGGVINLNQTLGNVLNNTVTGDKSIIKSNTLISVDTQVLNNFVTGGSFIKFDTSTASIGNNNLSVSSGFDAVLVNGFISQNTMTGYSVVKTTTSIGAFTTNQGSALSIDVPIILNVANYSYGYGQSNFFLALDFSDPTIWDVLNKTLTIPINQIYNGVFELQNASGVTIEKIINMPQHKSVFTTSIGTSVTFKHTLVASAVAGNLCCDAPSSSNVVVGRVNGCDFIEYKKSGTFSIRTNLVLLA